MIEAVHSQNPGLAPWVDLRWLDVVEDPLWLEQLGPHIPVLTVRDQPLQPPRLFWPFDETEYAAFLNEIINLVSAD